MTMQEIERGGQALGVAARLAIQRAEAHGWIVCLRSDELVALWHRATQWGVCVDATTGLVERL